MATQNKDHDRIATAFAAYGGDVARWPSAARSLLDQLPEEERRRRLRSEAGMDAVLKASARAADEVAPPDALMERIMRSAPSGAEASVGKADVQTVVVPLELSAAKHAAARADAGTNYVGLREWRAAAALLAASLVLGLFVGSTDLGRSAVSTVGDVAGIADVGSTVQMSALDEALQPSDEEDLL